MPGIAGMTWSPKGPEPSGALAAMLGALSHRRGDVLSEYRDGKLGAAIGGLGGAAPETCAVLDGEIYDSDGAGGPGAWLSSNLSSVRGTFAGACLDRACGTLRLVSDRLGLKPLYYAKIPGGLAFASEVKAVLAAPGVASRTDERALADLFHFGALLGCRTLSAGIELLPPGSVLTFNLRNGSLQVEPYWRAASLFAPRGAWRTDIEDEEVAGLFARAVTRRLAPRESLGISLSGGLDSRSVVAALGEAARGVASHTVGLPECRDRSVAEGIARVAGTRHTFLTLAEPCPESFEAVLGRLVWMTEGLYSGLQGTAARVVDYFATNPFRAVLRGHGGEAVKAELAYPLKIDARMRCLSSPEAIARSIYRQGNVVRGDLPPEELFAPSRLAAIREGPLTSVREALEAVDADLTPEDLALCFYLREWVRRRVVASLALFRPYVEVRMPFLDEDFLDLVLKLPLEKRSRGEIQTLLVRRFMPALLTISNSNTGASLNAGRLGRFLASGLDAARRRLRLPGHRHYVELERWHRGPLRAPLERVLFDERTLSRGLYRPEGLRKVFDDHMTGRRCRTNLLCAIVELELFHRSFMDP
ncbi:MAG TPA: asparagine synthase-related protein [Thermoanaerobaculia bacterium]|nr:asparagine synthase-related protein [Thermoanaerobaculia bacterium]